MRLLHYGKAIHRLPEKMVNYGVEICKLLPRDRKNVVLYTVTIYNHFHNILVLFDVLSIFPFTTSETMRNYYLETW